jgi:hypothetical protein
LTLSLATHSPASLSFGTVYHKPLPLAFVHQPPFTAHSRLPSLPSSQKKKKKTLFVSLMLQPAAVAGLQPASLYLLWQRLSVFPTGLCFLFSNSSFQKFSP